MAISVTTVDDFLKEQFDETEVEEMQLKASASPLYKLIKKDTTFGGEDLKTPVIFGDTPSGSAGFTEAQAYAGEGFSGTAFKIETGTDIRKDYSLYQLEGLMMVTTDSQKFAFFNTVTRQVQTCFNTQNKRCAIGLYRGKDGAFGNLSATGAISTTIVMAYRGDMRWLTKGFRLSFRDPALTTIRNAAGVNVAKITNVNLNTLTITLDIDVSAWGDPPQVNDDVLFAGDNQLRASGLEDWVPDADPAATLYFGVDRTEDIRSLSGTRYNAAGKDILESLIECQSLVNEFGPENLAFFLPPETSRKAKEEIRASTEYTAEKVKTAALKADGTRSQMVSVNGFAIDGDNGPITVYTDPFCRPTKGYLVDLERFTLLSAGVYPRVLREDGLSLLRMATADAYEGRVGGYTQIGCDGPGNCAVLNNLT